MTYFRKITVPITSRLAAARMQTVLALIIIGLIGLGLHANQPKSELQQNEVSVRQAELIRIKAAATAQQLATQAAAVNGKNTSPSTASPQTTSIAKSTTSSTGSTIIKYSTSDNPRSTAYSTTPPVANAADFDTIITHAGQVAPGTQISYSAEKQGESTYYGGDLVFSSNSLTYSVSSGSDYTIPIIVRTPDGDEANMPSQPVNDLSSFCVSVTNVSAAPGTSWTMMLDIYSKPTPQVAPYVIHLQTFRLPASGNDWEYDGFISLYVVN